jgi:hypothetical protein
MIKTNLSSSEIQDLINKYSSELKKLEFQTAEVKMTLMGLENLMKDVSSREKASFAKVKIKKTAAVEKLNKKSGQKSIAKKAKVKVKKLTKAKAAKESTVKKAKPQKATIAKIKKESSIKKIVAKPKKELSNKKVIAKPNKKAQSKVKSKTSEKIGYKLSDWDNYVIQSIEKGGKVLITSEIIDQVKSKLNASGKSSSDAEIKNKVTRSLQKLVNRRGDLAKVSFQGKGFAYALPKWVVAKGKAAPEYSR